MSAMRGHGGLNTAGEDEASATDTVTGAASSVVDNVRDAGSAAVDTAQHATSAVTETVSDTVEQASNAAAGTVERLADTVAQTVFNADAPRVQRQIAEKTVNVLDRSAEYLRGGTFDLVLEDLRGTIRQHPLRSLVLGLGLGLFARGAFFPGSAGQAPRQRGGRYVPEAPTVPVYSGFEQGDYDASRQRIPIAPDDTALVASVPTTTAETGVDALASRSLVEHGDLSAGGASGLDVLTTDAGTSGSTSADVEVAATDMPPLVSASHDTRPE